MTVKLNLLPPEYGFKKKSSKVDFFRVFFMLISTLFMVVSISVLVVGFLKIRSLENRQKELLVNKNVISAQSTKIISELERLKENEKLMSASLKILEKELPLLEFFKQLELSLPDGVWLTSIKAEIGKASMTGYSYNENDVVLFATGLLQSSTISQVGFPNTRRTTKDGRSLVSFKLSCQLGTIGQKEKVSIND